MTITLQQTIKFEDPTAVELPVCTPDGYIPTLVDEATAERLGKRKLSLGSHGYAQVWHAGQATPLHRWVLGCERGDGKVVDHVNGDALDNRLANLRIATPQMNAANRVCRATSGYRGVRQTGDRFTAYGKVSGRTHYLGVFDSAEEAAEVAHAWRCENLPGYVGSPRVRYSQTPLTLAAITAA